MDVGLAMTARNHPDQMRPLTEIYREVLDEAVLGEQLGFRSWWLAEHHFAEDQHNPSQFPLLAAAAARTSVSVEDDLHDLGIRTVVIPRKGKPGKARQAAEHRPAFRRAIKWRTGSEGRISTLKRQYGRARTRLDGTEGARTWTGYGVLAHNLVKIS